MKLKPGVKIGGIRPELALGLMVAQSLWSKELVVTAVVDGQHSRGSLHYAGQAADLRTRDLSEAEMAQVKAQLGEALGAEFDVVVEADHMHLEWQPKTGVNG